MSDAAREVARFLEQLVTPGTETRRWVTERNLRADAADIAEGLKNNHRQGQHVCHSRHKLATSATLLEFGLFPKRNFPLKAVF
jgi:hypothetical protein